MTASIAAGAITAGGCNTNAAFTGNYTVQGCPPAGYTTTTGTGTITAGGTDIGNHCDDCTTDITLPFPVSVYGNPPVTAVAVGSDGDIHFPGPYNKLFWWMGCVPVDPGTGQDPFLNTFFPNYADLVTDETVGPCPGCGIFTQTVGTAPNRQFLIRWKANYFNSPPGPAQAEFEVLLTEGSNTLSVIYGVTGDNGLTAVSGIQKDLTVFTSFSCNEAVLTPGLRVDGNSNANSWRSNTDSDGHVHANGYTDGDTYTDANGDSDGHFNTYSNAYARGQTYADAQAAADASPAGALIGFLKGGNSRNQFASSPPEMDRRAAIELAIPEKRRDGVRFGTEFPRPRKETQQEVSVGFARKSLRRCDCVIASLSIDGRLQEPTPSAASLL